MCIAKQEPLGSVMADIKYEACMSAVESNCHDIPRTVGEYLVQRSMTNKVYREAYTTSKVQRSLREIQEWVIKRRIDHTHNSRYPKLAARVTMDVNRGTRGSQCRMLHDKTPCPGYATEWSVAFHADMMTGGALNISQERLEYLQKLKKVTVKYFADKYNILPNQEQLTRAVHKYLMYLGRMEAGDYLCVNQDHHEKVKSFDSEPLMREHWLLCHGIVVDEILVPWWYRIFSRNLVNL